jgi:hypothetical protein
MVKLMSILIALCRLLQEPTRVVLGQAERDLTGDGIPEMLRVVGVGPSIEVPVFTRRRPRRGDRLESAGRAFLPAAGLLLGRAAFPAAPTSRVRRRLWR